MSCMDWEKRIKEFDVDNVQGILQGFVDQCREGYQLGKATEIQKKDFKNIFITGMGGSGYTGTAVKQIVSGMAQIPIVTTRGYQLPAFVNQDTLTIAISFSGNTEETIAAFKAARDAGSTCIGICSGGEMEQIADTKAVLPGGINPRYAQAYMSFATLGLLKKLGIISEDQARAEEAIQFLESHIDEIHDRGQELALALQNHFITVYATEPIECAAIRWQKEFNENAKTLIHQYTIPEMNHNEINITHFPKNSAFVFLQTKTENEQIKKRLAFTREVFEKQGAECFDVVMEGQTILEQVMYSVALAAWTTFHYAIAIGENPDHIPVIEKIKMVLKQPLMEQES
jgi:glucose/mannose-6-phosphate isomerase